MSGRIETRVPASRAASSSSNVIAFVNACGPMISRCAPTPAMISSSACGSPGMAGDPSVIASLTAMRSTSSAGRSWRSKIGAEAVVGALVADEQAALARDVAGAPLACGAAPEHRAQDEHRAEDEGLVLAGFAAEQRLVGEPDAEHEQRAELGQPRELLDRRLADALVVALVEAEDLGRRDDRREQQQRPPAQRVGRGEPHGHDERDRERDHVGERERRRSRRSRQIALDVEALGDLQPRGRCRLDKRRPG